MEFKNPWGKGSDQYDRWFQNEQSRYSEVLHSKGLNQESFGSNENNVQTQKVALAFWGGAKLVDHNSAFKIAARNTQKSYGSTYTNKREFAATGQFVIDTIDLQSDESIGRMDIVTHAGPTACYLVRNIDTKASGEFADIPTSPKDLRESNNLWASRTSRIVESGWDVPSGDDEATIYDIDTSKFTNDSIIEFHGCRIADTPDALIYDNIAENLSAHFYDNNKKRVVIIGHATKANPNINGEGKTKIQDQDYRHGKRIAVHNGKILFSTQVKRHIGKTEILKFLLKKEKNPDNYDGTTETL